MRPMTSYVLIRREDTETITEGGIELAHSAQRLSLKGEIVAIGNHVPEALELSVGDKVQFIKHSEEVVDDPLVLVEWQYIEAVIND